MYFIFFKVPRSVHRKGLQAKSKTCWVPSSIHCGIQKYHFSLKGTRAPQRNVWFRVRTGRCKWYIWYILSNQRVGKLSKSTSVMLKDSEANMKRLPLAKDGITRICVKIKNAMKKKKISGLKHEEICKFVMILKQQQQPKKLIGCLGGLWN